jgi:hypothetical protein
MLMPPPPTFTQRSPIGQGCDMLQSWSSPLPQPPCWHCVELIPRNPPVVEAQHTAPLGHVSAVHAMTTPPPPSAPHALALATHICSLQHTSGGLQTAAPHGTGPPVTTGPPPLLDPEEPEAPPEELLLPGPPSPGFSLLVEPPHATARAIPVPSDTAIPILIRMKASLSELRDFPEGSPARRPYVARSLTMGSRRRRLTLVARSAIFDDP